MWSIITSILTILGALGIFLYGMKVMSEGIQKAAGNGMRKALATMTYNRASSVFTGFFTTSLVQSSSATTVLVVSFVNAGLLTLTAAIGVIMGANLGTTVTAWLVAWIGKFSISAIALPIIGIGLPLFFIGKQKIKAVGETLIGFGLLFEGLHFLKHAVPNLKAGVHSNPELQQTIQNLIETLNGYGFGSIILFLIAGIILTLVVQSSSAAMAITITCAWNGWLGDDPFEVFQYSAAIVLGENIGTTVTAWLASIGTGVNAKRAARAHFLFNVIGTVWAIAAFYLFTKLIWNMVELFPDSIIHIKTAKGDAGNPLTIVAFAVALFHTTFNLINILLLVWFVPQIASIVEKWVKDKPKGEDAPRIQYISQSLVDLGELNIIEAEAAIKNFSQHNIKMFEGYVNVFEHPDQDMSALVNKLKRMEDDADLMMHDITNYLVHCSTKDITEQNAERLTGMLRITAELEECSDAIYRLVKIAERKYTKGNQFSEEHKQNIHTFTSAISEYLQYTHNTILTQPDMDKVKRYDELTAKYRNDFNKAAMKRMANGDVKVEMLNISTNNELRGIANQLTHICKISAEIAS